MQRSRQSALLASILLALIALADKPAFFFGRAFYEALRGGGTIADATIKAREAARRDDATWLAYVVYAHPHARMQRT
jgi:hypothetical protein